MNTRGALRIMTAAAVGLLTGCALKYTPPRNSKYSVDNSRMEKSQTMPDTWIYRHPTKRVREYSKFWISSFEVFPNPVHKVSDEMRAQYTAMANRLDQKVRDLIGKNFEVVDKSGPGVLELRMAVIDIKPVVHLNKDGVDTVITDPETKGSKFELDASGAQSGEQIYAISTLLKGEQYSNLEDPSLGPLLEKEFPKWIDFLIESLKKAKAEVK